MIIRRPLDVGGLALVQLAVGTLIDSFQAPDRIAHLGEVSQQQIAFENPLDRIHVVGGSGLVGADDGNKPNIRS